jgi:Uma2 family endonuclease
MTGLGASHAEGDGEDENAAVLEREAITPGQSALKKILIVHLADFEKPLQIAVRPGCSTHIEELRYRVPDIAVMIRPFRQNDRVMLDAPFAVIEILSPYDRMKDTLQRFREYEMIGVRYIVQMDPEDRTTFAFVNGDLVRRDLQSFDIPIEARYRSIAGNCCRASIRSRLAINCIGRLCDEPLPSEARLRHNVHMRLICALLCAAALAPAADLKLGKPLTLKEPMTIAVLLAKPSDYVGKTVQVKGKITEVCEMMGCWMDLVNAEGQKIRIKVNDGEIEFPKGSSGKIAIAEGSLAKIELTKEQAVERGKEEAEDRHRKFDPASVKGPVTIYQIQGTGAVILE